MNTLVQQATAGNGGQGQGASLFDQLRHVRPDGTEFWSARELMGPMGYGADWRNFRSAITRAEVSASAQGFNPQDLFVGVTEKSSGRPREDVHLVRFAAYLVAMNGDPRKREIAAAQAYFAVRTREAETSRPVSIESIIEDPDFAIQALTALRDERQLRKQAEASRDAAVARIEAAERELTGLRQQVQEIIDAQSGKDNNLLVRQVATNIKSLGVLGVGQDNLFSWLVSHKWLYRTRDGRYEPTSRSVDMGRVAIRHGRRRNDPEVETRTAVITPKGATDLMVKFKTGEYALDAPAGGGAGE